MAFLGGPLHFLDQLRHRFIETLKLKDDEIITPENSELFVAMGAALSAAGSSNIPKASSSPFQPQVPLDLKKAQFKTSLKKEENTKG